jgi:hypothetical protein
VNQISPWCIQRFHPCSQICHMEGHMRLGFASYL